MATDQNNFEQPSAGASDWDASLNSNWGILEQGYRSRAQAGEDIRTGHVVTVGSDGFALMFDPNSEDIKPHLLSLTALSSGDEFYGVAFGAVRSIGVWSGVIPGHDVFVSALTPGLPVSSYSGANRGIGFAHFEDGFVFDPRPQNFPELVERVTSIDCVNGSLHLFTMDFGLDGWNRRIHMVGDSADLVELSFYSNSARSDALYLTISGGVTVVGSHIDQAGWPYYNTDANTINGLVYGTLKVMSDSVASDSIGVTITMERYR